MSAAGKRAILATLAFGEAQATEAPTFDELVETVTATGVGSRTVVEESAVELRDEGSIEQVPEDENLDPEEARYCMSEQGRADLRNG